MTKASHSKNRPSKKVALNFTHWALKNGIVEYWKNGKFATYKDSNGVQFQHSNIPTFQNFNHAKQKNNITTIKEGGFLNQIKISALLSCIFFFASSLLNAQGRNEEVTIIAPYQPTIIEAFKINFSPAIQAQETASPDFEYDAITRKLNTTLTLESVQPVKPAGEKAPQLKRNYLKAGFGNYLTPYLEFSANSLQSKDHALGLKLNYISSNGGITDYAPSGFSHSGASIYGKKFSKSHTLGGEVFYKRDMVHFYGFYPDSFPNMEVAKEDIRQRYQLMGGNFSYSSNYIKDDKLNHAFSLELYHLDDIYKSKENAGSLKININKNLDLNSMSGRQILGLDAEAKYFNFSDSLNTTNRTFIRVIPYFNLDFDQYRIYAGVDITADLDSSNNIHVYPLLKGEVFIIGDALKIYLGIRGGLNVNTFRSVSSENMFITSTIPLQNTNNKFDIFGGINGSVSSVDYFAEVSNSTVKNMLLFVNDTSQALNNQFTAIYDDANLLIISAGIGYHKIRQLSIMLKGRTHFYSMDKELEAWQKPGLEVSLEVRYTLKTKYIITGEFYWFGPRYAKTYENGNSLATEMPGGLDLNLGVEYRITSDLSLFLNLRNLTGNQYQKWHNYPVQGFQVMVGGSYSF